MAGVRVHADDTVVPVLARSGPHSHGAALVYVRDDRPFAGPDPVTVFYRYTPDRKGEHPRAHLSAFRGILQADGYAGFAGLYGDGRVVEAACLAHARRKFWDVHEATKSPLASAALDRIAALYGIEDTIRGRPPDQRLAVRAAHSAPLMAELREWLYATRSHISGRSELAGAIRHALSRWDALTLILRDGRACIDRASEHPSVYVVEGNKHCWAGCDPAGYLEVCCARSVMDRAAGVSRAARAKIQGPSGKGWIASTSPASAANLSVLGATRTSRAALLKLSQGSFPSSARLCTGMR